ncbi:unnamed protein product [Nyctereutes procyonoides]|uniref:(raccoon dog) hypothetical protein n=1 Tax=Nyctereutes procyonoides TaxID=34880 RepID=A0A811ZZ71_NYCPR|nr:unnamed protein product [Nyctereutes procyonoides]
MYPAFLPLLLGKQNGGPDRSHMLASRAGPPLGRFGRAPPQRSYMAKFVAELLGCTLPSKGAAPMFEVVKCSFLRGWKGGKKPPFSAHWPAKSPYLTAKRLGHLALDESSVSDFYTRKEPGLDPG